MRAVLLYADSDFQEVAERFQRPVRFMRKNPLCQHLPQLYSFLVKAVQVPQEALEHHLVFKMRQQRAKCFRCQSVTDNDTRRPVSSEVLISVFVLLSAGKGHYLGSNIRAQLLLAR